VWDLETVPDIGGFAAANDLVGQTDADIRAVLGNRFPKHIYHTIVCIGALVAHRESDHWAVDALGAPHVGFPPQGRRLADEVEREARLTEAHAGIEKTTAAVQRLSYEFGSVLKLFGAGSIGGGGVCVDRMIVIAADETAPAPRHDALTYVKSRADAGSLLHLWHGS
jgi:hypothetical protein